jgi:S-adenosylmethionine:tRNA ribosyltransferase-isomerase
MLTKEFFYDLPPELIAQEPIEPRDAARLLVVERTGSKHHDHHVREVPQFVRPGDLIILNRTRVIPARLFGKKASGGAIELLLIHPEKHDAQCWRVMIRGKVQVGHTLIIGDEIITVENCHDDGERTVRFSPTCSVLALAERVGHMPLPPYIKRADRAQDRERYQTVFGDRPGSVAAPTASLHLTTELLTQLRQQHVHFAYVDLAIGPGTFKPVDTQRVEDFRIHAEQCSCPPETIQAIHDCRKRGGRVIAVGTTVVRTVESAAAQAGGLAPYEGWTSLFLYPPQQPRVIDGLLTNFHLPQSSLLMLVSCFVAPERLMSLYRHAMNERYRFFSYGDAMLIL